MSKAEPSRGLRYVPLLLLAGLAVAIMRLFVAENNDMAPGMQEGDLVLLLPHPTWLFGPLRPGDLVLQSPFESGSTLLRRVAATPRQVVEIAGGRVLIEGQPIPTAAQHSLPQSGTFGLMQGRDARRNHVMEYPVEGRPRRFRVREEQLGAESFMVAEQEALVLNDRPGVTCASAEYYLLADRRTGARDSRDYGPKKDETLRRVRAYVLIPGYRALLKGW